MPLPDIFSGDENAERLASYFEEIYDYLVEAGIPHDRLPSPWHILSRAVSCVDHERLREWLDAYVAIEADVDTDDTQISGMSPPKKSSRRRPSYLQALERSGDEKPEPET